MGRHRRGIRLLGRWRMAVPSLSWASRGFCPPKTPDGGRNQPKRYLWLLAAVVPVFVYASWLGVLITGVDAFWWTGPILAFGVTPVLDHSIGTRPDNPPDSILARLENDRFYRWATYLYLPSQYLSLVFACWLWAGGGWITMDFADKLGLMATVGIMGGLAINAAHELG